MVVDTYTEKDLEDLKERVAVYGRKRLSKLIGIRYSRLSNKLNEYLPMTEKDYTKIVTALETENL